MGRKARAFDGEKENEGREKVLAFANDPEDLRRTSKGRNLTRKGL